MILIPVTCDKYQAEIRALFGEYFGWIYDEYIKHWGVEFGLSLEELVATRVKEEMSKLDILLPPNGRFYLAQVDGAFIGVGALKQLNPTTGEIKKMFVLPQARGNKVGKKILDQLLDDGRSLNYDTIYLDSPKFCNTAQRMYQSRGFRYIDGAYLNNENNRKWDYTLNFMQLDL